MKKIKLNSRSYPKKYAIVDDEDYNFLKKYKWSAGGVRKGGKPYARCLALTPRSMHRIIMLNNRFDIVGKELDHINCNKLDNRKRNLRIATHQQNAMNCPKKRGKSKYKGVYYFNGYGRKKRWIAEIKLNYKKVWSGRFLTEKEAGMAYNKKAKELFKEFAYLNKI
jgi:hypothetical protein